MKNFSEWFRQKRKSESSSSDIMAGLLEMLVMTDVEEVDCEYVAMVLAEFAEMKLRGEDVAKMMPLVQKHLEMCPDCREEYEALMIALESEESFLYP